MITSNIETREPGYVYRQNNDVKFYKEKLDESRENEHLLSITCNREQFFLNLNPFQLDENENISSVNSPWFSLKNSESDKKINLFKINEGDVIKIGKIIIRIRRIKINKKNKRINNNNNNNNNSNDISCSMSIDKINNLKEIGTNAINDNNIDDISINNNINTIDNLDNNHKNNTKNDFFCLKLKKSNKSLNLKKNENLEKNNNEEDHSNKNSDFGQKTCRICYQEDDTKENPLIQPCLCSGSLKYIHLKCLKQWIGTRSFVSVDNNEYCSIFLVKEINCELCKSKLPDYIRHKNKLYKIIEFNTDFKNYLSFENLTLDKQKNKFIYIINLDKNNKIKIGRGHESNVLLSDISVSRIHCLLNVDNNEIYLEDNNSKYGTLVLIQTPKISLVENLSLNLHIGRSFINCKIKKPFKLFTCCDMKEKINFNTYFRQNEKKIGMKKVLTVKTEVNSDVENDSDEFQEQEQEQESNKVVKLDIDVDEDDDFNKSCISFSKYNFRSNENCKNLLNSISYRKIEILSPIKKIKDDYKNASKNDIMNDINNTDEIPVTLRTGRI